MINGIPNMRKTSQNAIQSVFIVGYEIAGKMWLTPWAANLILFDL